MRTCIEDLLWCFRAALHVAFIPDRAEVAVLNIPCKTHAGAAERDQGCDGFRFPEDENASNVSLAEYSTCTAVFDSELIGLRPGLFEDGLFNPRWSTCAI
jgi:hypothetical protein